MFLGSKLQKSAILSDQNKSFYVEQRPKGKSVIRTSNGTKIEIANLFRPKLQKSAKVRDLSCKF